jgi:hypothetical protein
MWQLRASLPPTTGVATGTQSPIHGHNSPHVTTARKPAADRCRGVHHKRRSRVRAHTHSHFTTAPRYYPSELDGLKHWNGTCPDVVGAVLTGAAKAGGRVMLSCEWVVGEEDGLSKELIAARIGILRELAVRYGTSPAFGGWYFASEAYIAPHFTDAFLGYVAALGAAAAVATPGADVLLSPYGTRGAVDDAAFVAQLRNLSSSGVTAIAYQDEVGCVRDELPIETVALAWATLASAHAAAGGTPALWANVEAFTWEGPPNTASSPLVPTPWPRLLAQLAAAAPHVARVITFSAEALLDAPTSPQSWGPPDGNAQRAWSDWQAAFPLGNSSGTPTTLAAALLRDAIGPCVLAHAARSASVVELSPAPLGTGFSPDAAAALMDGVTGVSSPFGSAAARWVAWRASTVNVVIDLGASIAIRNGAVHALAVSPAWYVDGNAHQRQLRNITSRTPAAVRFYGASRRLAPNDPAWTLFGETTVPPWAVEEYDTRVEVALWELAEGDSAEVARWVWVAVDARAGMGGNEVVLLSEIAVNAQPQAV